MEADLVVHNGVEAVPLLTLHTDALDVALNNISEVDLSNTEDIYTYTYIDTCIQKYSP